jgi:hypothetical protein
MKDIKNMYRTLLNKNLAFQKYRRTQEPVSHQFFIAQFDSKTISMYYQLRKELSSAGIQTYELKKLIKNMPIHIWLLRKYVFETLMAIGNLIIFYFFMFKIPVFKGKLSVFITGSLLLWFFLREAIRRLDTRLTLSIGDIIEQFNKDIKRKSYLYLK